MKTFEEALHLLLGPLDLDLDPPFVIKHPPLEPVSARQAVNKGAETHPLNDPLDEDVKPSHPLFFEIRPSSHWTQRSRPSPVLHDTSMISRRGLTLRAYCLKRSRSKST